MRPVLTLHTTLPQLEALFADEDRPRRGAGRVLVDRKALKAVLLDHANMLNALRDHGRVVHEPENA